MANSVAEAVIGAVVLATAAGFVFYAGQSRGLPMGGETTTLHASFRSAEGITVGTDVRLAGEFPGDRKPKPVRFPDPAIVAVRGEHGALPPVPRTQRQQHAGHHAERERQREQDAVRHGLDDLEITEAAWHLHGADGPIHDEEIPGRPGDRDDHDPQLEEAAKCPGRGEGGAAREGGGPRALGGFDGEPTAADQNDNQERRDDQVYGPLSRQTAHACTPARVSQSSTSAR